MTNGSAAINAGATGAPCLSIGILAWNEEEAIEAMLASLFEQSLFSELSKGKLKVEIICVANGCTDKTAAIAARVLAETGRCHPFREVFSARTVEIKERGKIQAWNLFVHRLSAKEARFLLLMDGDIVIHRPNTLWNMYLALADNPEASVAVDQPIKDIALQPKKSLLEKISLGSSEMTRTAPAQLSGQLYCIKASVARNIYLPRDLLTEDGFIKAVVCTDFLTRAISPGRIQLAKDAAHIFQAYTAIPDILKNQKRQMIAQTMVHLLVDRYLKNLPLVERLNLAQTLKEEESADPLWLKRLIAEHLRRTKHFWRLFPGLLTFRFERLGKLEGAKKVTQFPAALAGFLITLVACWQAHRFLKQGCTDYWPDTSSPKLGGLRASPCDDRLPMADCRIEKGPSASKSAMGNRPPAIPFIAP